MVPYVFTIVTTIIMYISIFCFWRGTNSYLTSKKHQIDDKGYSQLHMHCLLLKGIPRHMAPGEARRHIKRILNMVEGIEDKIYSVNVVEDFNEFFNLKQELQNLNRQIALSQKYELMLTQLEKFRDKTELQKKDFLKKLNQLPTTTQPFYRICPNYFEMHKQNLLEWKNSINIDRNNPFASNSQPGRNSLRMPRTSSLNVNLQDFGSGRRPSDKRASPDKRGKRANAVSRNPDGLLRVERVGNHDYDAVPNDANV